MRCRPEPSARFRTRPPPSRLPASSGRTFPAATDEKRSGAYRLGGSTPAAKEHWDDPQRGGAALNPFVESFSGPSQDQLLKVEES